MLTVFTFLIVKHISRTAQSSSSWHALFSIRHRLERIDNKPCRSTARKPSQEDAKQKTKRALTLVKINRRKTAYQPAGAVNDPVQS